MFSLDLWREIGKTIRKNKLRTFLTAFSVSWGIFMLVILLGTGNGFLNGVEYQFRDAATNSIWIQPGTTTKAWMGSKPGKNIRFDNQDLAALYREVPGIERMTARFYVWDNNLTRYKSRFGNYTIRAVTPDHEWIEKTQITSGRFLNLKDINGKTKVVVLGKKIVEVLFKGINPVGEYVQIKGIPFLVIGTYTDAGGDGELEMIYMPISTAQLTFNGQNRVDHIIFTTGKADREEADRMLNKATAYLAARHHFDPTDQRATMVWNNVREFEKIQSLFANIRLFVWMIGLGTIVAGVVGIGNIMLISVKERTKEIGIRKALGATPGSIISLVLLESVAITFIAGYAGLFAGMALLETVSYVLNQNGGSAGMFRNPEVDVSTALAALSILVGAGALAGFFPARKAAMIQPVEALRSE